jgi:hypothetical protein
MDVWEVKEDIFSDFWILDNDFFVASKGYAEFCSSPEKEGVVEN